MEDKEWVQITMPIWEAGDSDLNNTKIICFI